MNTDRRELPAMVNIGVVDHAALERIVIQFPARYFTVTRGELCWKVRDHACREVLSAAIIRRNTWHVRACEGLLKVT